MGKEGTATDRVEKEGTESDRGGKGGGGGLGLTGM